MTIEDGKKEYHENPALSSSQVSTFLSDPIEWYHVYKLKDWPRKEATPAMQFGTLTHKMFEIGSLEELGVTVKPEGMNFATKEGKAWKADHAGMEIISADDYRKLKTIWQNANRNEWIKAAIETGEKEEEIFWNDPDLGSCRCLFDCLFDLGLVDWKTTSKNSERGFLYEILDRNYDVRLALYVRGLRQTRGGDYPVHLVAINTGGGCSVTPYTLPQSWMDDAEARLMLAVDAMRNFDIEEHCNRLPKVLTQPKFSELNFGDDDQ
jgi:hypothetical protein